VQKTYSPNYPGEFGGGVINLTTLAIPKVPFLKLGVGVSADTETTDQLGYDHYGSKYDWTGYNSGLRNKPDVLWNFLNSGERLSAGNVDEAELAGSFVGWRNAAVQKIDGIPVNSSASLTGGTSWSLDGGSELGLVATAGYDNKWRTRENTEQSPASADLSVIGTDYRSVATENRIVANGLLGVGYEFGDGHRLRWTNLYVHDTLKRTSLAEGTNSQNPNRELREQDTGWYERQLLSTQLTGDFNFDPITVDGRLAFSKSKREAPFELGIGYSRSNSSTDPYGAYFINRLDNGATGFANVAFSNLDEDLISGGADLGWKVRPGLVLSAGYDYAYTARDSARREFLILNPNTDAWNNSGVFLLRPDYLLNPAVAEYYGFGLIESTENDPAFAARMLTHGLYAQVQTQLLPGLELATGARFERGKQVVRPTQVFSTPTPGGVSNLIKNDYLLPSATLTWKFGESNDQQMRFNVSKTIARPQFRELMGQAFYDPESNRTYRGNPLLSDSEFINAEMRYENYFASEQRFSLAGFYKKIDRPIEVHTSFNDNTPVSSFANAPEAVLYGAELELQKYFSLDWLGSGDGGVFNAWLAERRVVFTTNYTFTNSEIKVGPNDTVQYYTPAQQTWNANQFFRDGSQLTGQSDHLVNLQIGFETPGRLSQQTILLSYASDRVTSRGGVGSGLPDIYESPGLKLDVVLRQGFALLGQDFEGKLEARNILARGYKEFQERAGNIVYYNKYDVGATFSLSVSTSF
jgi:outer membrane receptor protein involved in Fe transport